MASRARKTPSAGSKPDKLMRDALALELSTEITLQDENGRKYKIKKLRLVARALVTAAIDLDVPAIKEIYDRMDGKVPQSIRGPGAGGAFPTYDLGKVTDADLAELERIARAAATADGNTG